MTATQPLEVLIIGAGFAGIGAAIKLLEKGVTNFRVFDKAGGVGGTWWHNRYPGAACDVPSHFYCYSFEPNPDIFAPLAKRAAGDPPDLLGARCDLRQRAGRGLQA